MFYPVLTVLFAIYMQGSLTNLNDKTTTRVSDRPKFSIDFGPVSNNTDEGSLIWFNSTNATTINKWVNLLQEFLQEYTTDNGQNKYVCDFDQAAPPGKACAIDLRNLGSCGPANKFAYHSSTPCVYLKLNSVNDWVPEYYNDVNNLPDDMPAYLVEYIKRVYVMNPAWVNQIWISCKGKYPADEDNINSSSFLYYPSMGVPGFYYPSANIKGYLSPLVAVQLTNFTHSIIINIECRVWAKNINYLDREGSVQFEILRDA